MKNTIEPPKKWAAEKRQAAQLVYGVEQCDNCLKFIYGGNWAFKLKNGKLVCSDCFDKGVR